MKKSIAKSFAYNLFYQIVAIIVPLITTPFLARTLGPEKIGIFGFTLSNATYFMLIASFGINLYGQREVAYVVDDVEKRSKLFWEINVFRIFSYSITLLIYYFLLCRTGEFKLYYFILLFEILGGFLDITWFFTGMEEFKKVVLKNTFVRILTLFLIFMFIKSSNDLWKYYIITSLSTFVSSLSLWVSVKKYVVFDFKNLEILKHVKPVFLLFLPQIAVQIYSNIDKTMIGFLTKNMDLVGFYNQAQTLIKACIMFVTALGPIMFSRIAITYKKKDKKQIEQYIKNSVNVALIMSLPCILGIIAIANKFVPWFYGVGYDSVASILKYNIIIILFISLNNITGSQYLIVTGKQKEYNLSILCGLLINVILNYILIPKYNVIGAVVASLISELAILLIQLTYMKDVIKLKEIFKLGYKYLISSIIMFFIVHVVTLVLKISILNTFIEIITGIIVYIVSLLVFKDKLTIKCLSKIKERLLNNEKNETKNS